MQRTNHGVRVYLLVLFVGALWVSRQWHASANGAQAAASGPPLRQPDTLLPVDPASASSRFVSTSGLLELIRAEHPGEITDIQFACGFGLLAVAGGSSTEGLLTAWDVQAKRLLHKQVLDWGVGKGFDFSPDGKRLAVRSAHGIITILGATSGDQEEALKAGSGADCLAFSPRGNCLAAGYGDTAALWDLTSRRQIRGFPRKCEVKQEPEFDANDPRDVLQLLRSTAVPTGPKPTDFINDLAFSPDGTLLAIAHNPKESRGIVRVWSTQTGQMISEIGPYGMSAEAVQFSPRGELLAVGTANNVLELWDTRTWKLHKRLSEPKSSRREPGSPIPQYFMVKHVQFSADGHVLGSAHFENHENIVARFWDVDAGRCFCEIAGSRDRKEYVGSSLCLGPDASGAIIVGSNFISMQTLPRLSASAQTTTSPAAPEARDSEPERLTLFPIVRAHKYGYMNRMGKVVVEPQYDRAETFAEGLAWVEKDGKGGYIDPNGREVTPLQYHTYSNNQFSEGMAAVNVGDYANGKWGFINRSGALVIQPEFELTGSFSEGLAFVVRDRKRGFVDRKGDLVIPPSFEMAQGFSEGLAPVRPRGGKWGYIDKSGTFVIPPQFDMAMPFNEGLAFVVNMEIGQRVSRGEYCIDKTGKIVLNPGGPFFEGLAVVNEGTYTQGRWGYRNRQGEYVIAPQFADARRFSEGLAAVQTEGKWGFINKQGKLVIQPKFSACGLFHSGLAPVSIGGTHEHFLPFGGKGHANPEAEMGYIDTGGDYVWQPGK
jgi:hypothetical protein